MGYNAQPHFVGDMSIPYGACGPREDPRLQACDYCTRPYEAAEATCQGCGAPRQMAVVYSDDELIIAKTRAVIHQFL